jgi:hypothetical protein
VNKSVNNRSKMQITLTEIIGFFGIIASIATAGWVLADRFGRIEGRLGSLEGRVGKLEEKMDEVLVYLKSSKKKHAYRKN